MQLSAITNEDIARLKLECNTTADIALEEMEHIKKGEPYEQWWKPPEIVLPPNIELSKYSMERLLYWLRPDNMFTLTSFIWDVHKKDQSFSTQVTGFPISYIKKGVGKSSYALWTMLQLYRGNWEHVMFFTVHYADQFLNLLLMLSENRLIVPAICYDDASEELSPDQYYDKYGRELIFGVRRQLPIIRKVCRCIIFTAPHTESIAKVVRKEIDFDIMVRPDASDVEGRLRTAAAYHNYVDLIGKKKVRTLFEDNFGMLPPELYAVYEKYRHSFNVQAARKAVGDIERVKRVLEKLNQQQERLAEAPGATISERLNEI